MRCPNKATIIIASTYLNQKHFRLIKSPNFKFQLFHTHSRVNTFTFHSLVKPQFHILGSNFRYPDHSYVYFVLNICFLVVYSLPSIYYSTLAYSLTIIVNMVIFIIQLILFLSFLIIIIRIFKLNNYNCQIKILKILKTIFSSSISTNRILNLTLF